jgi:hypothetical protein
MTSPLPLECEVDILINLSSKSLDGKNFYDTKLYLTRMMLVASAINNACQQETEKIFTSMVKDNRAIFRPGPLKGFSRSQEKVYFIFVDFI